MHGSVALNAILMPKTADGDETYAALKKCMMRYLWKLGLVSY